MFYQAPSGQVTGGRRPGVETPGWVPLPLRGTMLVECQRNGYNYAKYAIHEDSEYFWESIVCHQKLRARD